MPTIRILSEHVTHGNEFALSVVRGHMLLPGEDESYDRLLAINTLWKVLLFHDPEILRGAKKSELAAIAETAAISWTPQELLKRFHSRKFDGRVVGMMVCSLLGLNEARAIPRSLSIARDRVLEQTRGQDGRNIDVRQFDAI